MSKSLYTLEEKKQFVENIKKICKEESISIQYIAKCSGLDKSAFYHWFNYSAHPNFPKIISVSKVLITLNIPIDAIFENIRITEIGKNILKLCIRENIDIAKLSEILDITEKNIYYLIIGVRTPSTKFTIKLIQFLITKNIPIEEIFEDITICPLGISILKTCTQVDISISNLSKLLYTKSENIYKWIYGISVPTLQNIISMIKLFINLNTSYGEIFSSLNISSIGKIILEQSAIKDSSLEELAIYLGTTNQTISNWIYGKYKPSKLELKSIAHFFNISLKELSLNLELPLNDKIALICNDKAFLSKFYDVCDVSQRTVYNWINGTSIPNTYKKTLIPIIKAFIKLDIPINDILTSYNISPIGKIILEQLSIKDTSLEELASYLGTTNQTVNNWIYGKAKPKRLALISIAIYFDIPIQDFCGIENLSCSTEILSIIKQALLLCNNKVTLREISEICGVSKKIIISWLDSENKPRPSTIEYIKSNISYYSSNITKKRA